MSGERTLVADDVSTNLQAGFHTVDDAVVALNFTELVLATHRQHMKGHSQRRLQS
jgi:hypothetical protein